MADETLAAESDDNPLEQLVELLVYAPIGLIYEYPDVLPKLIKRGKSQVQLAKFAGQMAIKQQQAKGQMGGGDSPVPSVPSELLVETLAKLITDVGAMVGLAPPQGGSSGAPPNESVPAPVVEAEQPDQHITAGPNTTRLPIDGYDKMTAKEVLSLLEDLTRPQLARVRDHEQSNRNRKTVLAKIDRLVEP